MSARALSASGLRPPGLADTVRLRVFCPSYRPATVWKEKKLTSFPNENRKAREKYLYFPMQEIELHWTCLMPKTYGYGDMVQCDACEKYLLRTIANKTTFLMYIWKSTVVLPLYIIITSFSYKDHFHLCQKSKLSKWTLSALPASCLCPGGHNTQQAPWSHTVPDALLLPRKGWTADHQWLMSKQTERRGIVGKWIGLAPWKQTWSSTSFQYLHLIQVSVQTP